MNHILKCHEIIKTDFVRGENCYLYDAQGRRYVDLESGIWCTVLGHRHPRVNKVMQAQIGKLIHLGTRYPNALATQAAVDVLELVGMKDGKCTFLSSGSEAVEFGVQTARRVTRKPLLLTSSNAYLGAYGSAGRKNLDHWWLVDWSAWDPAEPEPYLAEIPFEQIGAFVFEPGGSGSAFVRFPPRAVVRAIARRVREVGGLLIVNEVTTGMGRTGRWFGYQHYGLQPDIVALGKGLGNGYPVSAVAMTRNVADALEAQDFHYAQSHQNDPLGCAIAREVVATLQDEDWIARGDRVGTFFLDELKRLAGIYTIVKEARGRGMLLGLELHPNDHLSVRSLYLALVKRGFVTGYYSVGNVLRLDPALTIDEADIASFIACLEGILADAEVRAV